MMLYLPFFISGCAGVVVGYIFRGLLDAARNERAAHKALMDWRRERFLQGQAIVMMRAREGQRDGDRLH